MNGAAYLVWSPNDKFLAVVGAEDGADLWIWNVEVRLDCYYCVLFECIQHTFILQEGQLRAHVTQNNEDQLSAVAWRSDSQRLVTGGQRGQFYQCVRFRTCHLVFASRMKA